MKLLTSLTAPLALTALFLLSGCPCLSVFADAAVELQPGLNRVNVLIVTDDVEEFTASFELRSNDPEAVFEMDATTPQGAVGRSDGPAPSLNIEADNCGDGCLFPVGILVPEGLSAPPVLQIFGSDGACDGGNIDITTETL